MFGQTFYKMEEIKMSFPARYPAFGLVVKKLMSQIRKTNYLLPTNLTCHLFFRGEIGKILINLPQQR
jgi:hypothetical protein